MYEKEGRIDCVTRKGGWVVVQGRGEYLEVKVDVINSLLLGQARLVNLEIV